MKNNKIYTLNNKILQEKKNNIFYFSFCWIYSVLRKIHAYELLILSFFIIYEFNVQYKLKVEMMVYNSWKKLELKKRLYFIF